MPVIQQSDRIVLKHPKGSSVEILLYGATVISWKSGSTTNPDPVERLFVSSKAALDGKHSKLSQHGFARNETWTFDRIVLDDDAGVSVRLSLEPKASIAAIYERPFHLAYVVTLAEHQLSTDLHVQNTALSTTSPLEFQALFHNYIRVPSSKALVTPLQGLSYYDKTEASDELRSRPKVEARTAVDVKAYTDFVYENAPGTYEVTAPASKLEIKTRNLKDVVIWNPQAETGSKIADMEDGGWDHYICVEPGYVRGFVQLEAGQKWIGQQVLTAKL